MKTKATVLGADWALLVDSATDPFLIRVVSQAVVEFSVEDSLPGPGDDGMPLVAPETFSRRVDGKVYGRCVTGGRVVVMTTTIPF